MFGWDWILYNKVLLIQNKVVNSSGDSLSLTSRYISQPNESYILKLWTGSSTVDWVLVPGVANTGPKKEAAQLDRLLLR